MDDKDLDKFMQMSKLKHSDIDKELDELMNEDEDLREIAKNDKNDQKGKKKNFDEMDDINMSDLDEEDEKKDNDDDIDLKELENEDKHKVTPPVVKETPPVVKETPPVVKETPPVVKVNNQVVDIYSEKSENLYHRTDKMCSMGVLQDEIAKMDEIVEYKKKNNFEFEFFENKKFMIDAKMKEIENLITFEVMDLEGYKKTITNESKWEDELIAFANKDQKISKDELKVILDRINKRKEIISSELTQEVVVEEEAEGEAVIDEKKQEEINTTTTDENKTTNTADISKSPTTKTESSTINIDNSVPLEKKQVEIINNKLYEDIKTKLTDYKAASEYFRKIGSAKQEEDAISKARDLSQAIKQFEDGKENLVDEFSLPIGVTPDYICGEGKQERLNHYSVIIKEFSNRKNELNDALQQRAEKLKTVDKKEFAKIKDAVKKDFDERKAKIEFHNKLITKLTDFAKNPWVPAPLFGYVEEEEKVEKINEDIEPNFLNINIGKSTYDKDNSYLYITLNLGDDKQLNEYVYFKQYPIYDHQIKWKLEKSQLTHLHRKTLEIQVYRKHWYWPIKSYLKGTIKIKLDALKVCSKISDSFAFKLESNRCEPKIDITVALRTPIMGKEYSTTSNAVMTITKTFPPFRGEGAVETHNYPVSEEKKKASDISISEKEMIQTGKLKQNEKKVNDSGNKKQPASASSAKSTAPNEKIDPSEFSKEELVDPDIPDNLNSVKVLGFKIEKIQQEINHIEGRAPPKLREKLLKAKCRKNVLEQQLGDSLSIDDYIVIMNKQLMKDQRLVKYFEQEKSIEQGKKVAERIPILIKEITDAIEYSKSQKKK